MEKQRFKCYRHNKINEIYCKSCASYICSKCTTDHTSDKHTPQYIHILDYSPKEILPKITTLLEETRKNKETVVKDINNLLNSLQLMLPEMREQVEFKEKKLKEIYKTIKFLKTYSDQSSKYVNTNALTKDIKATKARLEKALSEKNTELVLKFAIKLEAEEQQKSQAISEIATEMNDGISALRDTTIYDEALVAAEELMSKCITLKTVSILSSWVCDKTYLSSEMFLSKDGLTFGSKSVKSCVGIIGTFPFEAGMFSFAVVPEGLESAGKEGFGVIAKDKYLAAYKANPKCPQVYNDIIGYLYKAEAKNANSDMISEMRMGECYYVRVNTLDKNLNIMGPDVFITADLAPNTVYYPCFCCGSGKSKLRITPLAGYDDVIKEESEV